MGTSPGEIPGASLNVVHCEHVRVRAPAACPIARAVRPRGCTTKSRRPSLLDEEFRVGQVCLQPVRLNDRRALRRRSCGADGDAPTARIDLFPARSRARARMSRFRLLCTLRHARYSVGVPRRRESGSGPSERQAWGAGCASVGRRSCPRPLRTPPRASVPRASPPPIGVRWGPPVRAQGPLYGRGDGGRRVL